MARLSSFKVDSKAIETGEWIRPGDDYDDLEILTRGFTDSYVDARAAKMRRAAISFGGDTSKVPSAIARAINVECLIAHVVLDVRNLSDADGQAVSFAQFCGLLRDPDYPDLMIAVLKAAAQVGARRALDVADAAGNFVAPSGSPSNGADSGTSAPS